MSPSQNRTNYRMATAPAAAMPSALDFSRLMSDAVVTPVLEGLARAATNFTDVLTSAGSGLASRSTTTGAMASHHHKGCGCSECCHRTDPCHCNCCIVDADLVVYTRVGETRVVPLYIENKWKRERKIKLSLGEWARSGGATGPIKAVLLPPAPEFTIPPCGQQSITMVIHTGDVITAADPQENVPVRTLQDVDDCTVHYSHLTVTGCDTRPIRIAVALLPRDCDSYRVECTCGCC